MDIYLGRRYFLVDPEGDITPELILQLPFELPADCFFDVTEAMKIAEERSIHVRDHDDSIRKRELARNRIAQILLPSAKFGEGLASQPVTFKSSHPFFRDAYLPVAEHAIPKSGNYLLPGETAWIPITPSTHYIWSEKWRPARFFVLQTRVITVSWSQGNYLEYRCNTYFACDSRYIYSTEIEAKEVLTTMITDCTPATADLKRIQTHKDEEEAAFRKQVVNELMGRSTSSA